MMSQDISEPEKNYENKNTFQKSEEKNWPSRFLNDISCSTAQYNWKWCFELISKQHMNPIVNENWNKWLFLLFSFGDRANDSF